MARGGKHKPAKIHQLHGTYREDRHGKEMKVEAIHPAPPERLDEIARVEWVRLAAELYKLGILTALDITTLEMYCTVYSRWIRAEMKMKEDSEGEVDVTPNKYHVQSVWYQISNNCIKQLQSLSAEFGLTPATRARIRLIESQPKQLDLLSMLDEASKMTATARDS